MLVTERAHRADPEDPDEYRGAPHPVFWVPPEARWPYLDAAIVTNLLALRSGSERGKELGYGE